MLVVHDLLAYGDRGAVTLQRHLDGLHGTIDPGAVAPGLGEQHTSHWHRHASHGRRATYSTIQARWQASTVADWRRGPHLAAWRPSTIRTRRACCRIRHALGKNEGRCNAAPAAHALHAWECSNGAMACPDKHVGRSRYAHPAGHRPH